MSPLTVATWAVRIGGFVALLLGLVLWVVGGTDLRPVHMVAGVVLVIGLWTLSALALRGGSPALPLVAIAWGLLVPAFGLTQEQLLVGDLHWVVRIAHLAVGIISVGLGEALTLRAIRTERRLRNTR